MIVSLPNARQHIWVSRILGEDHYKGLLRVTVGTDQWQWLRIPSVGQFFTSTRDVSKWVKIRVGFNPNKQPSPIKCIIYFNTLSFGNMQPYYNDLKKNKLETDLNNLHCTIYYTKCSPYCPFQWLKRSLRNRSYVLQIIAWWYHDKLGDKQKANVSINASYYTGLWQIILKSNSRYVQTGVTKKQVRDRIVNAAAISSIKIVSIFKCTFCVFMHHSKHFVVEIF